MNRIASTIALILCTCCWLSAQELDFQVSVNAQAVASAEPGRKIHLKTTKK